MSTLRSAGKDFARVVARVCCALLLTCLLLPSRARAISLRVEPGVTCLDEGELRRVLEQLVSPYLMTSAVPVEVLGSQHDPRTVLLRVHHPDGEVFERTFSPAPERCPQLHQTVALALALTLKAVPPAQASVQGTRVDATGKPQRWQGLLLGAGGLFGIGVGRGVAGGGELSAALRFRHAELRALGLAARSSPVTLGRGQFDTLSVAARLESCGRLTLGRSTAGELCLGTLLGKLFLRGAGLGSSARQSLRQLGLSVDLGVGWALGHGAEMRIGAALVYCPEPLWAVVRDAAGNVLHDKRLPPVTGLVVLSVRYRFWAGQPTPAKVSGASHMNR